MYRHIMSLSGSRGVCRSPCHGNMANLIASNRKHPIARNGSPHVEYGFYGMDHSFMGREPSLSGLLNGRLPCPGQVVQTIQRKKKKRVRYAAVTPNAAFHGKSSYDADVIIIGSGIGGR